jgi:hypothetical protein
VTCISALGKKDFRSTHFESKGESKQNVRKELQEEEEIVQSLCKLWDKQLQFGTRHRSMADLASIKQDANEVPPPHPL